MMASKVLRDLLELVDRTTLLARQRPDDGLKAVIEMILDQGLFGLANGFLDRMELLGNLETGPACLDHVDDTPEMPIGSLKPFDGLGMC
jgi:hypothetical protein